MYGTFSQKERTGICEASEPDGFLDPRHRGVHLAERLGRGSSEEASCLQGEAGQQEYHGNPGRRSFQGIEYFVVTSVFCLRKKVFIKLIVESTAHYYHLVPVPESDL